MDDALLEIWDSTRELHKRFFPHSNPPFDARRRVLFEEFGEFTQATDMSDDTDDMCNEAADLIVTIIGMLYGEGIMFDDLESAIEMVIAKNDAKTLETHQVRLDGKIARVQSNGKS